MQLYITINSVQADAKKFITVNVHQRCYFFVYINRLIYIMCLECLSSTNMMHVLSHACHWPMDASIVRCLMLCQMFIVKNKRRE